MSSAKIVVFSICPICREGKVEGGQKGHYLCRVCGAEFAQAGVDTFKLVHCDPNHPKSGPFACVCRDRVLQYCLLGKSLSKADWEHLSIEEGPRPFREYEERRSAVRSGQLPTESKEKAIVPLQEMEVVHAVVRPVFAEELHGVVERQLEGILMVTNLRLVYKRGEEVREFRLEDLARVEEAPPGFLIVGRGEHTPQYFYPPALDPVYDVLCAALAAKGV